MLEAGFMIKPKGCWAQKISEKYKELKMEVFSIQEEKGLSRWSFKGKNILMDAYRDALKDKSIVKLNIVSKEENEMIVEAVCNCENKYRVHKVLAKNNCFYLLPNPIYTMNGAKHYKILVPDRDTLKNIINELKKYSEVRIESVHKFQDPESSIFLSLDKIRKRLTEKQLKVLKKAYSMGYYNYPRKTTLKKIADDVGVSNSTLHEELVSAENSIIDLLIEYL
ncbi:MAG: helix-turn-helix domain-containing protein [Methanomicrobia archaeon]|nr:helix-turn-helix domain-containing protein [Methanomicrobia archaeon]